MGFAAKKDLVMDSGCSWVVLAVAFLGQAMSIGFYYCFGPIYTEILVLYETSETQAGTCCCFCCRCCCYCFCYCCYVIAAAVVVIIVAFVVVVVFVVDVVVITILVIVVQLLLLLLLFFCFRCC